MLAEQGSAEAQSGLGYRYLLGLGVPQDDAEALRWIRLAADQGHAAAQFNLGLMYGNGRGVSQDVVEALRWYRLAADQGHALAQSELGTMYANGQAVPQDDTEALGWFRRAADQGHAGAQYNLGFMYSTGQGVAQDDVEAYVWFNLAAAQSAGADRDRFVAAREAVAERMTSEQLADAGRRHVERPVPRPFDGPPIPQGDDPIRPLAVGEFASWNARLRAWQPSGDIEMPRVVREVKPQYTEAAMRAKVQGAVWLEAVVLEHGTVGDVRVVRSLDPDLDRAAVVAATQWRFIPGTRNGEPVSVLVTIQVTFTPE